MTLTDAPHNVTTKVEGEEYRVITGADGKRAALQLNDKGLLPKAPVDIWMGRQIGK